jgi:hypothetical protein
MVCGVIVNQCGMAECKVQGARCKVQGARCKMQDANETIGLRIFDEWIDFSFHG